MKELIMTYGLPGSGKDFYATELMRKHPGKYKRVNKDHLRQMLDASVYDPENEKLISNVRNTLVKKFLSRGFSVIVSDTNFPFGGKSFTQLCDIAKLVGDVTLIEKFIDTPLKICKEQNEKRVNKVPEAIIDNMFKKHIYMKPYTCRSIYFEPVKFDYSYISTPNDAIIIDVDGTIAFMSDRTPFEYNKILNDIPNEKLINLISSFINENINVKTIVVSGREDCCKKETIEFLNYYGLYVDEIYMRETGDSRTDEVIKEEIYNKYIKNKYNIKYVFDDRNKVVDMWRRNGLFTLQVSDGDF